MPGARKEALAALAGAAQPDPTLFQPQGNVEETVAQLRAIRGIGEWTAHYIALRAVREAIGAETLLMLDMNAPYDLEECIAFAHAVEPSGIFWLEEPLHWYLQPADYVRLARATSIPLAHGERELTRFTARDFIASGAIRYFQFDATRYAGFTEALRIAHFCEQQGVAIAPHSAPELHAHLVAACPRCAFGVESHGDARRDAVSHGLFRERAHAREGYVQLSGRPGFGIEIDWDFVRKYRA